MTVAISTTTEQVSVATEGNDHQKARARQEARRESIARYLAGESIQSNYEAMVHVLERDPNAGALACEDCGGKGYRELARHVLEQLDTRLEHQLIELEQKQKLLRDARIEAHRPRPADDDIEDRLRQHALRDVDRLEEELIRLHDSMDRDADRRKRRARCRTCRGTRLSRRRRRDDRPGRPDSMFSTAPCPRCIGADTRRHPKLMTRHVGTSAGSWEARMRGPRVVDGSVVSDWRDDAAAERGDVCDLCVVEYKTPGYVTPITCRPILKAADVELELPPEDDDAAFRGDDFAPGTRAADEGEALLDQVAAEDPTLAAAIALLAGDKADRECVLWPLTMPGRCLAEESSDHRQGDGYERLLALCEAEVESERESAIGSARRRLLLGHVRREARLLRARAEARLAA